MNVQKNTDTDTPNSVGTYIIHVNAVASISCPASTWRQSKTLIPSIVSPKLSIALMQGVQIEGDITLIQAYACLWLKSSVCTLLIYIH